MKSHSRSRRAAAWSLTLATATLAMAPLPSGAFTSDARRIGMGSAVIPGSRDLAGQNVAYQSMPSRRSARGLVIPLPLGLIQLASNFPTFDAQDSAFSITRIANLALSPPFFLELSHPSDMNGDIRIALARNSFSIDFEDAKNLLPQKPVDVGGMYSRPLFGLGLMGARTYVSPLIVSHADLGFDDAFYGVLAHGDPVLPLSTYRMTGGGEALAASAFSAGYSEGGWGDPDGNGLYLGAYAKYILGFGMAKADNEFSLSTHSIIFGDSTSFDVGYDATTRTSRFGRFGNGFGVDTGVAYRMGAIDFGLGVRDIGSSVHWSKTEVRHTSLKTGVLTTDSVATIEKYTSRIPTQTTLNVGWSGERRTLAADITTSSWGTALHLGAEQRLGQFALRGGLLTDDRAQVQYAWGMGMGLSRLWLDLGFQTHSKSLTGERGLMLATSLAIR